MRITSPAKGECLRCVHQGARQPEWLSSLEAHMAHTYPHRCSMGGGLVKLLSSGVEGRVNPVGRWVRGGSRELRESMASQALMPEGRTEFVTYTFLFYVQI